MRLFLRRAVHLAPGGQAREDRAGCPQQTKHLPPQRRPAEALGVADEDHATPRPRAEHVDALRRVRLAEEAKILPTV